MSKIGKSEEENRKVLDELHKILGKKRTEIKELRTQLAVAQAAIKECDKELAGFENEYPTISRFRDRLAAIGTAALDAAIAAATKPLQNQLAAAQAAMKAHNDDPEMVAKCGAFTFGTDALDEAIAEATKEVMDQLAAAQAQLHLAGLPFKHDTAELDAAIEKAKREERIHTSGVMKPLVDALQQIATVEANEPDEAQTVSYDIAVAALAQVKGI